ncbi:serologically defined colon cancer antigen 8 homolog [Brachionichthys hirsutus]|uniref:serologically defined colon cancer antigen 8 homolog n=1 Tax=Brachionichthys hirsutus TaxID=412623 RepID=UPI0036046709
MKPINSDEEESEPLSARHNELRKKANQSIQQLSGTLEQLGRDGEDVPEPRGADGTARDTVSEEDKATWSQKSQSEAANQLKSLLLKQCKGSPSSLPTSKKKSPPKRIQWEGRPSLPADQDLVPMNHNQPDYIQHLEAEVKFYKEELQGMKQLLRVVVGERESKAVDESLTGNSMGLTAKSHIASKTNTSGLQEAGHSTWKHELEQLKGIYEAQVESLEAQMISLRKDLSVSRKEYEEVKVLLRHKEKQAADAQRADGAPRVSGLCLKCAQLEAVMPGSQTNLHLQSVDSLTRERDELLAALQSMKTSQQEVQQREWSACLQVKHAVAMTEEAKLSKAKTEAQCEQLSRELARHRQQLERQAQSYQRKLAEAREESRAEAHEQREDLAHAVSSLSKKVDELEGKLERAHRDKNSLASQLGDALCKLTSQEQNNIKVCSDLRHQFSQAQLKTEDAERALRELKSKTTKQMEKAALEVEKLSSELVGRQQHLEAVQKDGSQWQAEALSLAEQLANAQRQLHLTRQDRERAERAHEEEMASLARSAQGREKALAVLLEQTDAQTQQKVAESDSLMSSQNSLIGKLMKECCMLGVKLQELTEDSRNEKQLLELERQHLEETVKGLRARCTEMEEQCVHHGSMHQRMKDRLQQLDRHCQNSAQQVCELLAKQNQLMLERNTLTEEMQNLQRELPNMRRLDTLSM